jgi:hypothetical protein
MRFEWAFPFAMGMVLPVSVEAQVIPYFEGKLDCDTAYTNLEMGLCSRYLLDSATARMNELVSQFDRSIDSALTATQFELSNETDSSYSKYLSGEVARLSTIRRELSASQATFVVYSAHCREVVGEMIGMGRERSIQENYAELEMVIARTQVLKRWLEFY